MLSSLKLTLPGLRRKMRGCICTFYRYTRLRKLFAIALLVVFCYLAISYLNELGYMGEEYDLSGKIDGWISETVPNCSCLLEESPLPESSAHLRKARNWRFSESKFRRALFGPGTVDKCQAIREKLAFPSAPLSEEEGNYSLAYGLLVYKSSMQVYLLLSAIYQPQNVYCIAVDSKASRQFKKDMELLSDCFFDNILIMPTTSDVEWCEFGVARGVFSCLRYLSEMKHDWKYYQYLSGVDLPLKTNLEMVRIFNRLNGTANVEVLRFQKNRLASKEKETPPLPLWKSSLSALLPRETVDAMFASKKVHELFSFLTDTVCADESLWATIVGNQDVLPIPGSFHASEYFIRVRREKGEIRAGNLVNTTNALTRTPEDPFPMREYYISRYQVWKSDKWRPIHCAGKYVQGSCVFGAGDLANLMIRPEMIAHKLYLDFEPAAYFCLYQAVRRRALDKESQQVFRGDAYTKLPQVRMTSGEALEEVQFFFTDW
ncbi:core-2/I-Branching enzyme domain-containing protein [Ditylenchus destructor]|uniref:Core-2/I-Branching enzyme domain-containing protein n=1 Tax=Ditylenchus destructor TaxID=166010 RepID=A0AAD4MWW5_9BILA|nr:core-2/I-Branching enzyme domain-containing protein [Ditylenchus destructor]